MDRRGAKAAALILALLAGLGLQTPSTGAPKKKSRAPAAAPPAPVPALPPDLVAPKVEMDNDLTKELARGGS